MERNVLFYVWNTKWLEQIADYIFIFLEELIDFVIVHVLISESNTLNLGIVH